MSYPVVGSPTEAFTDGVRTVLKADTTLLGLVSGVFDQLPETERTTYPYVVLGRRSRTGDTGAMGVAGSRVALQVDVWSDAKGPHQTHTILSRIARLLERQAVTVTSYTLIQGSVTCEFEDVFDEPDEDKPGSTLYHGVQRWAAEIHES